MKNSLSCVLAVVMVFTLAACKQNEKQNSSTNDPVKEQITVQPANQPTDQPVNASNDPDSILNALKAKFGNASKSVSADAEAVLNKLGNSYDSYSENKDSVMEFYSDTKAKSEELYSSVKLMTVNYYKTLAENGVHEYKTWNRAMEDFYDIWNRGMEDFYDAWNGAYDNIYKECDDLIREAPDTIEYDETSDSWSSMYSNHSDSWSEQYDLHSDAWSDLYDQHSAVWSGFYDGKTDVDQILAEMSKEKKDELSDKDKTDEDNANEDNTNEDNTTAVTNQNYDDPFRLSERTISGMDQANTITFHEMEFKIPSYFNVKDSESTDTNLSYYPDVPEYYSSIVFLITDLGDKKITEDQFTSIMEESANRMIENMGENFSLVESKVVTLAGLPGWTFSGSDDLYYYCYYFTYDNNFSRLYVCGVLFDAKDESNYDYLGDFKKVMDSAKFVSGTKNENMGDLRPEFKNAMDEYEEFMDEYVAFMEKYEKSGGADMSLLVDYAKIMSEYVEFTESFDKWENEDMNESEMLYYIEVQSRVTKKLLSVSGNES